jgi:hypothetical protein
MLLKKSLLYSLILFHMMVVAMNLTAFFVIPFFESWYIALPIMTLIFNISFAKWWKCPLTDLENKLRRDLNMKEIRGFMGHYFVNPARKILGYRKCNKEMVGEMVNAA